MTTPHINAADGAFASTVLLPGDPRRAQHIAETFLDGWEQVTDVRGMLGFTGTFEGHRLSVMASGMGIPSAAIYITELIRAYGVSTIIRVGTAGVYQPELKLRQIVVATDAVTNSNLPEAIGAPSPIVASPRMLDVVRSVSAANDIGLELGTVFSSDIFYEKDNATQDHHTANGVLAVEMETAALYAICAVEGAEALAMFTMTDHLVTGEHLTSDERQLTVDEMLELGLRTAVAADQSK
ncbi:MAG: purine-nucleoside phosphorylase [Acidimicrobiia bacterium]|nr:purine-nucleoside phosphorylase [Acidimicrobiia bacterium]